MTEDRAIRDASLPSPKEILTVPSATATSRKRCFKGAQQRRGSANGHGYSITTNSQRASFLDLMAKEKLSISEARADEFIIGGPQIWHQVLDGKGDREDLQSRRTVHEEDARKSGDSGSCFLCPGADTWCSGSPCSCSHQSSAPTSGQHSYHERKRVQLSRNPRQHILGTTTLGHDEVLTIIYNDIHSRFKAVPCIHS